MTSRKIQYWVIPPEADGEFAAHMEKVLDVYEKPYDSAQPVLCMDEQPVQLIKETRKPIAATVNMLAASTMNMNERGRPASSCLPSRWRDGVRRPHGRLERSSIGLRKWPG